MRPWLVMGPVVLLVGLLFIEAIPASAMSITPEPVPEKPGACNGVYKGKRVAPDELASVLDKHRRWGEQEPNGQQANLCGVLLQEANLQQALLYRANLQGAVLYRANLQGTVLYETNLQAADLHGANLQGTVLYRTNLQQAHLQEVNLQGADLHEAKLQQAYLYGAHLHASSFEPVSLPDIRSIASVHSLSTLRFDESPQALQELREAFKKAGYRHQEREITYALWHTQRVKDEQGDLLQQGEGLFKLIFFEWPCAYGLKPGRPLLLLVLFMPLFAIVYPVVLRTRGDAGIWAVWPTDRVHKHADEETPRRLTHEAPFPTPPAPEGEQTVTPEASRCTELCTKGTTGQCALCDALAERDRFLQWFPAARLALYFSLLSAFHLGWRELNVGTWITRLQPREYTLRTTGWVRVISGVQSLLSVYLLALWALTYFGRPFE